MTAHKTATPRDYLLDRVELRNVVDGMGACWVWKLAPSGNGYTLWKRRDENHQTYVHRVSYIEFKGAIPDGFQVDHLCFNRRCVNPEHLEAVTASENMTRAQTRRWADHDFSLFQRGATGIWVARLSVGHGAARIRKEFYSKDREKAAEKMRAYLAAGGDE
jgi:hypothetical protein